jgi:hypothetical protein
MAAGRCEGPSQLMRCRGRTSRQRTFDAPQPQGGTVPKIISLVLIALALTACNDIKITPVDHTCLSNPALRARQGINESVFAVV